MFSYFSGSEFAISSLIKARKFDPLTIRSFQLLHKCIMGCIGFVYFPLHSITGQCVVFCLYSLIKHWGGLDSASKGLLGMIGTSLLLFWLGVLDCGGRFYKLNRRSMLSWKKGGKYVSKFCKSCKPLGIGLEGTFIIKRLSVLKFLRAVVKGTFRALVALKK
jgi:hypothetical protein